MNEALTIVKLTSLRILKLLFFPALILVFPVLLHAQEVNCHPHRQSYKCGNL